MTAVEIIEGIKQLPPNERAKVIAFVESVRATPDELVSMADRMVETGDKKEADALEDQILERFYGK